MRLKSDTAHQEVETLVDQYLERGGTIRHDSRGRMFVCSVCKSRKFATANRFTCRKCGSQMRAG
jgi:transcription initiation factor IIE alpha subunit